MAGVPYKVLSLILVARRLERELKFDEARGGLIFALVPVHARPELENLFVRERLLRRLSIFRHRDRTKNHGHIQTGTRIF